MDTNTPTTDRLDDQIGWYDRKSISNQRMYKLFKVTTVVLAAAIPLLAAFGTPALFLAILGAIIAIVEGLQSLYQFQSNWLSYRATCEELKHEKYLFLAKAGPYLKAENAIASLAERSESLISRENAKWVSVRERPPEGPKPANTL